MKTEENKTKVYLNKWIKEKMFEDFDEVVSYELEDIKYTLENIKITNQDIMNYTLSPEYFIDEYDSIRFDMLKLILDEKDKMLKMISNYQFYMN